MICATGHGLCIRGWPSGAGWARYRPAAGVRLAFRYVPGSAGGAHFLGHGLGGGEERVSCWAHSTHASTARSVTIRAASAADNGRSPTATGTRSRWPEAGARHRPGSGGRPSSASIWTLPGAGFRPVPGGKRHVSSADAGLWFTRGVSRPFCLCWRPDIGAQCRVRIGEKRHWPRPHGAVGVGAGQELAVRAERHAGHAPPRAGTGREGSAGGLPGGRVPQPHDSVAVCGGQELAVRAERHRRARRPRAQPGGERRRPAGWPGSTAARCRRRRRWPGACRPG